MTSSHAQALAVVADLQPHSLQVSAVLADLQPHLEALASVRPFLDLEAQVRPFTQQLAVHLDALAQASATRSTHVQPVPAFPVRPPCPCQRHLRGCCP